MIVQVIASASRAAVNGNVEGPAETTIGKPPPTTGTCKKTMTPC